MNKYYELFQKHLYGLGGLILLAALVISFIYAYARFV